MEHKPIDRLKMQEIQRLNQEKTARAEDLFEKAMNEELFPMENVSCNWKWAANISIMKSQPITHRLPLKDFARVIACDIEAGPISLFQFGVLNNSIEAVSPEDLLKDKGEYIKLLNECVEHGAYYAKRFMAIKEKVRQDVESEFKIKTEALKASGGLAPIIGKA